MQTPSCERFKTIQRTLFLSFKNKNCWENPGNLQATCSIQTTLFILYRKSKYHWELSHYLWRSRVICDLNVSFLCKQSISISACYSLLTGDVMMNRQSGVKMFLSAITAPTVLAHLIDFLIRRCYVNPCKFDPPCLFQIPSTFKGRPIEC